MHVLLLLLKLPRSVGTLVTSGFRNPATQGVTEVAVLLILIGSVFYWKVEGWAYIDALYFSVVTLTTVGYGDLTPSTDAGKLFTVVYILVGLGIIAAFVSTFATSSIEVVRKRRASGLTRLAERDRIGLRRRVRRRRDVSERDETDDHPLFDDHTESS